MPQVADAVALPAAPRAPALGLAVWSHLRHHLASLNAALARRLRYLQLGSEVCTDVALPPDAILGEGSYDPALPFFLQQGFDRAK